MTTTQEMRAGIASAIEIDPCATYEEYTSRIWADGLTQIPEHMRASMVRYILLGIRPGNFLTAVLQGDLFDAVAKADETNRIQFHNYVRFLHNYAPGNCYGDTSLIIAWAAKGGFCEESS